MSYSNAQYSDLLRAINQTGSVYNYGNPQFVNPYSGAAYSPFNYREIMSRKTAPVDPRSAFTDYKPSFAESLATGSLGYQMGSQGLEPMAKGIYSSLAEKSYAGSTAGLTLGSTIYGATRDQNPYEVSPAEQFGNIAGPAAAGYSMAPMLLGAKAGPWGALIGAIAGIFINKAQIRKAEELDIKTEKEFQEERTEYTEDIAKEAEEQREQYALGAEADLWGQEASKYSNQYGAYANPYGQSYYDKGGKMKLYNGGGGYGDPPSVWGCMDSVALNYNPAATMDDGTCTFAYPSDTDKDIIDKAGASGEENVNPDRLTDAQLELLPLTLESGPTRPPYESPIQRFTKEKAPISEVVEEPISPRSNVFLKDKRTSAAPEDLEAYRWDLLNPYIRENVDIFDKGGKLTSKKKSKLKKLGRKGDSELAHINPQEKAMLEAMGGSGTTNPYTGLPEYHYEGWNPFNAHNTGHLNEGIESLFNPTMEGGVLRDINEWSTSTSPSDYKWADSENWMEMGAEAGWLGPPEPEPSNYLQANPRLAKDPRKRRPEDRVNVVDPFGGGIGQMSDTGSPSTFQFENYRWDLANPYIRENVDIFDKGGKLTKKEKSKLKKLGRRGDTELAHVNPQEKAMLKAMGGSGTINPYTGLKEYHATWNVGHMLGHGVDLVTSPIEFISDVIGGEEDAFGQFVDNLTFGEAGMGPDQTKTAVYNEETGGYEIQTSQPGTTLGFDPTGEKIGAAGLYGETPTGTGTIIGQTVSGTGWGYNEPAYIGAAPRSARQRATAEDKIKVVNPFQSGFGGPEGDKQASAMGLENYRWDLANPYIRENVDIFDEGGVVNQPESLPVDSMFNRQLFAESSFNPSAESSAGALGLSQITEPTFNDMIGWGWVPEGKEFSDLKTDTDLAVNLQERYMNDLMTREWNKGSEDVVKAKALAAYNMGPTALVNVLNKEKEKGTDIYNTLDWVNNLSNYKKGYKETTNYVNKIMLGGSEKYEQEYTDAWKAGGKEYDQGGITNTVAEFTGNELIINNQSAVEAGIKENNPSKAAAPIRLAMQKGFVTPGQETHGGNPMPVDDQGFIYTKGGKLPFRVRKNAGIYDHATDQFKQDMTDEQIMAVAKNNINKWEKNNMA